MWPYDAKRITGNTEDFADAASPDLFAAWVVGVVVAFVPALYGVWCLSTRSAHFAEGKPLQIVLYRGAPAIALGIAYLCTGLFLHLHFFWSWRSRYHGYTQIGKPVALLGVAGGICYFVFRVLIFG